MEYKFCGRPSPAVMTIALDIYPVRYPGVCYVSFFETLTADQLSHTDCTIAVIRITSIKLKPVQDELATA